MAFNPDKLKELVLLLQKDTITPTEIQRFLKHVLEFVKKEKDDMKSISEENAKLLKNTLSYIQKEHGKMVDSYSSESNVAQQTFLKEMKKSEKMMVKCEKMMADILKIEVKDGEDGEPGEKGDPGNDGSPDTPEQIVAKINSLDISEENQIDSTHIKGLPESIIKNVGSGSNIKEAPRDGKTYGRQNRTWVEIVASAGGAFTDLTDAPATYVGSSLKSVRVNVGETGLEFYTTTDTDEKVKFDAGDATAGYVADKIIAGTGISVAEGAGADENKLVITNSAPDQTVALTAGTNIDSITGTYPNFTINAATQAGGDVTKVGTPVNNQVGVWTGDGTLEGDTALTFDTTTDTLSTGVVLVGDGTATAPAYSFTSAPGIGMYNGGGNELSFDGASHLFTLNGTNFLNFVSTGINIASDKKLGWGTIGGSMDAGISRTSAGLLKATDGTTGYGDIEVADEAYGAGWNGSQEVPTKNALYDKIQTLGGGSGITRTITISSGAFTAGSTASTDYVYLIAGAHAVALPTAVGNTNRYTFKNNHSAAITITPDGAETIEGAATIQVAPEDSVDLISNNSVWFVI